MRNWMPVVVSLITSTPTLAADQSPVLSPVGPWAVAAEEDLCLLSHGFGTADAPTTLGFQPLFTNPTMEMMVLSPDTSSDQRIGEGSATLLPGGQVISARYVSVPSRGKGRRLTRLTVDSAMLAALASATDMTVRAGKLTYTFRLAPTAKALQALAGCQRDLLREWGVDPSLVNPAHAPQPRNPARYFGPDAYPYEAVRIGLSGRVVSVLQIDAAGAVSGCRVVASAGDALNAATCKAARAIRFEPARDESGRAVPSIHVLPVRWVLPE